MKLNRILIALTISVVHVFATGCVQVIPSPRGEDKTIPAVVTNVTSEALAGKVKLTYQLPDDPSLLYVKAVYRLNSGVMREVKSSFYTNTMILDGFGDTDEHEVKLYSVSKTEIQSEPVIITVRPLENPIWEVYRSLEISEDFGGIIVSAENPAEADVVIEISVKDTLGRWESLSNIDSKAPKIQRSHRGLDTLTYQLAAVVRDRFLNYTDTSYVTVHPLYEVVMDKSRFQQLLLPGDAESQAPDWLAMSCIWDGNYSIDNVTRFLTQQNYQGDLPIWFTFDMGTPAVLSRMMHWTYGLDQGYMIDGRRRFYCDAHLKVFEVWGTNKITSDGSFDSWEKLARFEVIKPSGLPDGQQTIEDYDVAVNGWEHTFPSGLPKVRYIRIVAIETWGNKPYFDIEEIELYGDPR